jgi:Pyruvate/2-oxoacid:ferredoxin oxidoreductase gamma subunit
VVLLGAYLAAANILPLDAVATALDNHLPGRQRRFLDSNKEALRRGASHAISDFGVRTPAPVLRSSASAGVAD